MTAANALTLAIEEGRHGGGSLFFSLGGIVRTLGESGRRQALRVFRRGPWDGGICLCQHSFGIVQWLRLRLRFIPEQLFRYAVQSTGCSIALFSV